MFLAMKSFAPWLVVSFALTPLLVACSSDSAAPGSADAASDAPQTDAGKEAGCPFGCATDSGTTSDAGDASFTCTGMRARIEQLSNAARACNPIQAQHCNGSTNGICCPISVSPGNTSAVNDFDQAVASYKASCPFDCSMAMCSMNVPSNACDAQMGSNMGICQ